MTRRPGPLAAAAESETEMSNEVRELKEHVRWLEDEVGSVVGHIEDQLDGVRNDIDAIWRSVESVSERIETICGIMKEQNDIQRQLSGAFQKLVDTLTPKSPPTPPPSFDEILKEALQEPTRPPRPPRPKRQKFKPKVVARDVPSNTDQPDGPGAA
jgi:hypothetical protein